MDNGFMILTCEAALFVIGYYTGWVKWRVFNAH